MTQTQESQAKVCTRCGLTIDLSGFRITPRGRPYSWCKRCVNEDSRSRYRRKAEAGSPRVYSLTDEQKAKKKESTLAWQRRNREKVRASKLKHERANRERVAELARARAKKRHLKKTSDPEMYAIELLTVRLRNRFARFINGGGSGRRLGAVISYTIGDLKQHIEAQFEPGMSWHNRRDWHIDHIRPLSSFENKLDPSAWDLPNLRPIWATENLKKSWKPQFLL